ncbi:MAG: DUF3987 domain-containing protein [Chlorobiota bacterium]
MRKSIINSPKFNTVVFKYTIESYGVGFQGEGSYSINELSDDRIRVYKEDGLYYAIVDGEILDHIGLLRLIFKTDNRSTAITHFSTELYTDEPIVVSMFEAPITNTKQKTDVSLNRVAEITRDDGLIKTLVNRLREGKNYIKKQLLDSIIFAGRFKARSREGLLNYSGTICMDFDNIKNPYKLLNEIIDLSLPLVMGFVSPSGHGLKAIFKTCNNPEKHTDYFKYYASVFKNKLGVEVDKSGKDIPRACFVSHDPKVFYMNSKFVPEIKLPESRSEIFNDFADKYIQNSKDGEKHNRLTKIAYLAGGYCAVGIVDENETKSFLKKSIVNRGNLTDVDLAFKTIDDCFEKGKSAPVSKEDIDKYLSNSESKFDSMVDDVKPPLNTNNELENVVYSESLFQGLPNLINGFLKKVKNEYNASSQLYAMFIFASGIFPKIQFSYGGDSKSLNLSSLILAESGSGKSSTNLVRELFMGIDKDLRKEKIKDKPKRLILSTNISGSELLHRIKANDGSIILYDTEISSFLSANSKEWGDYDTIFRQGASNDPIGQYRRDSDDVDIEFPQISINLTGTPSQITSLFKDKFNGLFSRFMYLTFTGVDEWIPNLVFNEKEDLSKEQELMLEIYKHYKDNEINLIMTTNAQEKLDNEFKELYRRYKYDPIISSAVTRHAQYAWKLCIIIKLFDCFEKQTTDVVIDADVMELALEIVLKSLTVATDLSFNLDQENLTNGQRIVKLLSQLGNEFTRGEVVQYCGSIFKSTTIDKYLSNTSLFTKIDYGKYRLANPKI